MKKLRRLIHWIGILIGALLFLWQTLQAVQMFQSNRVSLQMPVLILGAVLVASLANSVQTLAWRRIMLRLGYQLPLIDVLSGYSLSFLPRYMPGSLWGYVSRHEWLWQRYCINFTTATLGSFFEVLLIFIAGGFVMIVYLVQLEGSWLGLVALAQAGGSVVIFVWIALRLLRHQTFCTRLGLISRQSEMSLRSEGWAVLELLFRYFVLWCLHGLTLFLLAMSVGLPVVWTNFTGYTFSFIVAWSIGFMVLFIPSGLGVRELTLSYVLAGVLAINFPNARAIAILARSVTLLSEMLCLVGANIVFLLMKANIIRQP